MGFHNPDEALRILQNATDLARQAQMKAAQAADDPALLKTGVYDAMNPEAHPGAVVAANSPAPQGCRGIFIRLSLP